MSDVRFAKALSVLTGLGAVATALLTAITFPMLIARGHQIHRLSEGVHAVEADVVTIKARVDALDARERRATYGR